MPLHVTFEGVVVRNVYDNFGRLSQHRKLQKNGVGVRRAKVSIFSG